MNWAARQPRLSIKPQGGEFTMKKQLIALLSVFTVLVGVAHAELDNPGGIGGLESLRGATEIEATRAADPMKNTHVNKRWKVTSCTNHH
ncbi:Diheme cytochrome c napB [Vibrio mimicus VM603]|uniref:Diheme cytochrome c napB n=1 Tax=Vibrio mimicus VM603 TaxID=671074 RepID=D2YBW8_VIBMI|nr:Diheme cytochrome c napB [Vibrio mimicus VM603]